VYKKEGALRILFGASIVLLIGIVSICAQRPIVSCSKVKYESKNQVDPDPLVVRTISGQVLDSPKIGKGEPISAVCVALFSEKTKKLVKVVEPDDHGNFKFKSIKNGDFRLVVIDIYGGFCVANVPLTVQRGSTEVRTITVHMRYPAIDFCSFGDLQ